MGSKFWRKIFFKDLKYKCGGSHFCNKPFGKHGVKHKVTPYELHIGGQVKLSNREIMEVVNTNLYAGGLKLSDVWRKGSQRTKSKVWSIFQNLYDSAEPVTKPISEFDLEMAEWPNGLK